MVAVSVFHTLSSVAVLRKEEICIRLRFEANHFFVRYSRCGRELKMKKRKV